ncbi:hypothetical protein ZIOFF_028089 [Zingiber officinale]|uniref:Uncharacterized protein n=1 Tax=Zingiber officinale TaxID=94328 RepID=A0A8J5GUB8_ZINOF|nr:hypothetical protein ZIOFF_028089 [Zingiber officinale]
MAAIFPSFVPNRISTCPSLSSPATPRVALLRNSLLATPISLAPSRFFSRSNFRSSAAAATVVFMLPTAKPELASTGKKPRWSLRSIKSFAMAELEARKLKYPSTGTEALLMGILVEVDRLDCMGALWILCLNYKAVSKHIINRGRLRQFRDAFVNVRGSKGDLLPLASVIERKELFGSANTSALELGELIPTICSNYLLTTRPMFGLGGGSY